MPKIRDEVEFKRIYEKYFDTVYRIAYIHLKNQQNSLDIAQDIFYKLLINEKVFNDDEHIKAWLCTCTHNACVDFFRSKHNKTQDLDSVTEQAEDFKSDEIIELVLSLPEKYKTIIYMFYYEDYKSEEISKILNLSHSTVRVRLKRGREILKNKLGEDI